MARRKSATPRSGSDPLPVSVIGVNGSLYALKDALARQSIATAETDITALVNAIAALSARGYVQNNNGTVEAVFGDGEVPVTNGETLHYSLHAPTMPTGNTPTGIVLKDRAYNVVNLGSTVTSASFTLPALVDGKSRDFILNLTVGNSTAPNLTFVDPAFSGSIANMIVFGAESLANVKQGNNLVLFSECGFPTKSGSTVTGTQWLVGVKHVDAGNS